MTLTMKLEEESRSFFQMALTHKTFDKKDFRFQTTKK